MLSRDTRDSLLAVIILVLPGALWFVLDDDALQIVAIGGLVLGVTGALGIRHLLGHLDPAAPATADRRKLLEAVALGCAICAFIAFILLMLMYAD